MGKGSHAGTPRGHWLHGMCALDFPFRAFLGQQQCVRADAIRRPFSVVFKVSGTKPISCCPSQRGIQAAPKLGRGFHSFPRRIPHFLGLMPVRWLLPLLWAVLGTFTLLVVGGSRQPALEEPGGSPSSAKLPRDVQLVVIIPRWRNEDGPRLQQVKACGSCPAGQDLCARVEFKATAAKMSPAWRGMPYNSAAAGRLPARVAGSAWREDLVSLFVEQGLYYKKRTALNKHKRLMRSKPMNSSVSHLR